MSKMDYATLAVVAFCVTALVALTYRVVNLGKQENAPLPSAITTEPAYKDPYNDNSTSATLEDSIDRAGAKVIDTVTDELDKLPIKANPAQTKTREPIKTRPATTAKALEKQVPSTSVIAEKIPIKTTVEEKPTAIRKTTKRVGNSGAYLVVTGSFRDKSNAQSAVKALKKLGYPQAELGFFNNGAYASAIAGRFESYASANVLATRLREKHHIDAIVKKKQ